MSRIPCRNNIDSFFKGRGGRTNVSKSVVWCLGSSCYTKSHSVLMMQYPSLRLCCAIEWPERSRAHCLVLGGVPLPYYSVWSPPQATLVTPIWSPIEDINPCVEHKKGLRPDLRQSWATALSIQSCGMMEHLLRRRFSAR